MASLFDREPTPNKFTIEMGNNIRQAREEAGMSQSALAKMIFRRRATISDIENGKSEVGSLTLSRLSAVLDKPISFFFPRFAISEQSEEDISPLAKELLLHFDLLYDRNLKKAVIQQMKALSQYSPVDSLIDLIDEAKGKTLSKADIIELLKTK